MSNSILCGKEKVCFICNAFAPTFPIHKHHVIHGTANRKLSEQYGLWVYLCDKHHNMSNDGVHNNFPFDVVLKKYAQEKFEQVHGDRADFIRIFGKSYL